MNILDAEDMIKGLPDQTLMQQAQMPTGELPQFLVISEIQRRSDMRKRHEAQMQGQPQGTVKDQIMREGIAAMMPQQPMGMPPQMMPQGMPPQGGPQMPPQGMAPQGMPPMGMAAGGIVRMQGGGFLDQYVAGAEAGPMPGGSTIRDQLDRLLESGMSYPEILSFVSKTFYGRPEALEYVQSKIAMPETTMGSGSMRERRPSIDTDALISGMVSERVGDRPRIGDVTASDIYGDSFALGEIDLGMPTREQAMMADRAAVADMRSNLSPSLGSIGASDIDQGIAGMVSERAPRSGGIGRLFGFLNQKGSDYGPFPPGETVGESPFSRLVAEEGPYARQLYDRLDSVEDLTLYGMLTSDDKGAGGAEVQGAGTDLFGTGFGGADYSSPKPGTESAAPISEMLALAQTVQTDASNPTPPSDVYRTAGAGGAEVQGGSEVQAQSLSEITVDRDRKDLSGILSRMTGDRAVGDRTADNPVLDLSDIIAQSERMAQANTLMQLGAGIAAGDTAKALSAAGTAATKGMQEARTLDLRKRLAEYQAGREDIRRGEEADRFERQMALQERKVDISESQFDRTLDQAGKKIQADIDKGIRVNKGQLLNYIADVLKESGRDLIPQEGQTRQEMLTALQNQLLSQFGPFLDVDVSELVASGTGGGGQPDFSGFSIRN